MDSLNQVYGNYCGRCRRSKIECVCPQSVSNQSVPASKETMYKLGQSRFKAVSSKKYNRQAVLDKFGGKCAYCAEPITLQTMQIDHVIPQSDMMHNRVGDQFKNLKRIPKFLRHLTPFDLNHMDNLFPACRICNKWKNSHSLEEFRKEIAAQPERMMRDSPQYRMAKRFDLVVETDASVLFHFERIQLWKERHHA